MDDVEAVNSFMWTMVPTKLEIAHDTLVIAGPISHGCILTLDVDEENDSAAFKVKLDPDYK